MSGCTTLEDQVGALRVSLSVKNGHMATVWETSLLEFYDRWRDSWLIRVPLPDDRDGAFAFGHEFAAFQSHDESRSGPDHKAHHRIFLHRHLRALATRFY